MRYFPGDWDGDALPYGKDDEGERTVKQLIDRIMAEAHTIIDDRLAKLSAR